MTEVETDTNSNEKVLVARSSFNAANVIAAIALLIFVLGFLKWLHASPF